MNPSRDVLDVEMLGEVEFASGVRLVGRSPFELDARDERVVIGPDASARYQAAHLRGRSNGKLSFDAPERRQALGQRGADVYDVSKSLRRAIGCRSRAALSASHHAGRGRATSISALRNFDPCSAVPQSQV